MTATSLMNLKLFLNFIIGVENFNKQCGLAMNWDEFNYYLESGQSVEKNNEFTQYFFGLILHECINILNKHLLLSKVVRIEPDIDVILKDRFVEYDSKVKNWLQEFENLRNKHLAGTSIPWQELSNKSGRIQNDISIIVIEIKKELLALEGDSDIVGYAITNISELGYLYDKFSEQDYIGLWKMLNKSI